MCGGIDPGGNGVAGIRGLCCLWVWSIVCGVGLLVLPGWRGLFEPVRGFGIFGSMGNKMSDADIKAIVDLARELLRVGFKDEGDKLFGGGT